MLVDALSYLHGERFTWLSLVDPTAGDLDELHRAYGLHEVARDGILGRHDRPKFEDHDHAVFVVLRTAHYGADRRAHFGELAVVVGDGLVVTSRRGGVHAQGHARTALERRPDLLERGGGAVLWAILDRVLSDMRVVTDALEDDLDALEESVFSDQAVDHTRAIFDLRAQVADLFRAVHPMLAPLEDIQRGGIGRLREVRAHLPELIERARLLQEDVVAERERLVALLEADLALIGHRQNESVRKVSGWAAILAVPTLIAGVFGMNFRSIPGADDAWGFAACLALMLLAAGTVVALLRRAGWM